MRIAALEPAESDKEDDECDWEYDRPVHQYIHAPDFRPLPKADRSWIDQVGRDARSDKCAQGKHQQPNRPVNGGSEDTLRKMRTTLKGRGIIGVKRPSTLGAAILRKTV